MRHANPFSVVKASEFSDTQINELWVSYQSDFSEIILDLRSRTSKFIFGGKGTGKTHLLRYYSYLVASSRPESSKKSGIAIVQELGAITAFYRANHMSFSKFNALSDGLKISLAVYYAELILCEGILQTLSDIRVRTSSNNFDDHAFIAFLQGHVQDDIFNGIKSIQELFIWFQRQRKSLGLAVNNYALTQDIPVQVIAFSQGDILFNIQKAIQLWNGELSSFPLTILIDEFENLTEENQSIFNTFIRLSEGRLSFKIASRLKGVKGNRNVNSDEENLTNHEYEKVVLDELLSNSENKNNEFLSKCIQSRISHALGVGEGLVFFDLRSKVESLNSDKFMEGAIVQLDLSLDNVHKSIRSQFFNGFKNSYAEEVFDILTKDMPYVILQMHNLLRFYKSKKNDEDFIFVANGIRAKSFDFIENNLPPKDPYAESYSHWKMDLFAQICKRSKKGIGVPYAGYDNILKMCAGNPRNIMSFFKEVYSILAFDGKDFFSQNKISVDVQTEAFRRTALYLLKEDSSYGTTSDHAKIVTDRIARYLQKARFAENVPETTPLAFSFDINKLDERARKIFDYCIRFSFIIVRDNGRSDRNSKKRIVKAMLNPMIAPHWDLPIGFRGDVGINVELLNAIFDIEKDVNFEAALIKFTQKWNSPLKKINEDISKKEINLSSQGSLF